MCYTKEPGHSDLNGGDTFRRTGFRSTTFIDIAERSGISRGSISWHFANKDGLLKAVVEELAANMFGDSGPPVGIDAGIAHIDDFLRRPTTRLLITLVAEAVEPDSPVRSFYAELHGTMRKWTADWVDTMTLPPGVSRGDYVTILLGTTLVSIFDAGCDGAPGTLMYPISLSRL